MPMIMNNHRTFNEIYPTLSDFITDYNNCGIPPVISETNANTLFYLLSASYGTWQIASDTSDVFALKLFQVIWQYGPTWEKRLDIQSKIRNLSDEEIQLGSKAIYNRALNPGTEPSTNSLDELNAILEQNTTNYKKSKLEAYTQVWLLLENDVTQDFLNRFKPLFSKWNLDSRAIYIERSEDDNNE